MIERISYKSIIPLWSKSDDINSSGPRSLNPKIELEQIKTSRRETDPSPFISPISFKTESDPNAMTVIDERSSCWFKPDIKSWTSYTPGVTQ